MHIIKTAHKKIYYKQKRKMLWFFGRVSFDGEADHAPAAFSVTLVATSGKHKRYCSQ